MRLKSVESAESSSEATDLMALIIERRATGVEEMSEMNVVVSCRTEGLFWLENDVDWRRSEAKSKYVWKFWGELK